MGFELSEAAAAGNFREHIKDAYKKNTWRGFQQWGRPFFGRRVGDDTAMLQKELYESGANEIGGSVLLPYGLRVGPIVPHLCRVMSSAAKPFMLAFEEPVGYGFLQKKPRHK